MSVATREEAHDLVQRSTVGVLVCVFLGLYLAATGSTAMVPGATLLFVSGVCCAALVVLSWRLYHPYVSWLIWAGPGPALIAVVFFSVVVPVVRVGVFSLPVALLAVAACAGGGFFGTLAMFRTRITRWLATDGP